MSNTNTNINRNANAIYDRILRFPGVNNSIEASAEALDAATTLRLGSATSLGRTFCLRLLLSTFQAILSREDCLDCLPVQGGVGLVVRYVQVYRDYYSKKYSTQERRLHRRGQHHPPCVFFFFFRYRSSVCHSRCISAKC